MILTHQTLVRWAETGGIEPFHDALVGPASIDLRWSGRIRPAGPDAWEDVLDTDQLTLQSGEAYLLDTLEYVSMRDNMAGLVLSRTSTGRRGMSLFHTGYVDPGFQGTLTFGLKVVVPWGVIIERGQPLVQLVVLATVEPTASPYSGHYQGQNKPTVAGRDAP